MNFYFSQSDTSTKVRFEGNLILEIDTTLAAENIEELRKAFIHVYNCGVRDGRFSKAEDIRIALGAASN